MFTLTLSILFVLVCLASGDCHGKKYVVYKNKEIRLFNEKTTYYEAKVKCKQWGQVWKSGNTGRLVVVTNSEKQKCLEEMVSSPGNYDPTEWRGVSRFVAGYYIGADDLENEGKWMWSDNTAVTLDENGYNNWGKHEPTSGSHTEDCVSFLIKDANYDNYVLGTWVDIQCHNSIYYICERDIPSSRLWTYNNNDHGLQPQDWSLKYRMCGGRLQSPISLRRPSMLKMCDDLIGHIQGWNSAVSNVKLTITNTGRFVQIVPQQNTWTTKFKGSSEVHYISRIVLHVGSANGIGSEHAIGSTKYEAELQIFHKKAANGRIYALAFFLKARAASDNHKWNELLRHLSSLKVGSKSVITASTSFIKNLISDTWVRGFLADFILDLGVRYYGSLPYPPCPQNVIWTVHPRPVQLSLSQFRILRSIQMEGDLEMTDNFRPLQPTHRDMCRVV